jgi:MHS family citrate/tricarballylate:H+ symporter-like MFS transporter
MVKNWSVVLEGMLLVAMTTTTFYLITVYTPAFGKTVSKLSSADSLVVPLCVGISNFCLLPMAVRCRTAPAAARSCRR